MAEEYGIEVVENITYSLLSNQRFIRGNENKGSQSGCNHDVPPML